jgi:hypothetical protein
MEKVISASKQLQEQLEQEVSRRLLSLPVNLMSWRQELERAIQLSLQMMESSPLSPDVQIIEPPVVPDEIVISDDSDDELVLLPSLSLFFPLAFAFSFSHFSSWNQLADAIQASLASLQGQQVPRASSRRPKRKDIKKRERRIQRLEERIEFLKLQERYCDPEALL